VATESWEIFYPKIRLKNLEIENIIHPSLAFFAWIGL
jgi:hypothetical protein